MRYILFVAVFAIPLTGFSQKVKKPKRERPAPQWDTLYFKNEFSVDVSPVINFLTGDFGNVRQSFGATYRRFFDKNDALRIGTRHGYHNYATSYDRLRNADAGFVYMGDSILPMKPGDTVFTRSFQQTRYYTPDIRFGYEHRFGKRRVKCMLGVDALIGVERIRTIENEQHFTFQTYTDSLGTSYFIVSDPYPQFPYNENIVTNLKVGLSPFVGAQIHLTKRFSLNACFLLDLFWTIPVSGKPKYSGFNISTDAFIADIGFTVHF
ncbi:MAG: hypothetical protein KIS94_12295 [Chitinophagales bacterium]|nr:hypothetical protein [Chitinophagales bacterium]